MDVSNPKDLLILSIRSQGSTTHGIWSSARCALWTRHSSHFVRIWLVCAHLTCFNLLSTETPLHRYWTWCLQDTPLFGIIGWTKTPLPIFINNYERLKINRMQNIDEYFYLWIRMICIWRSNNMACYSSSFQIEFHRNLFLLVWCICTQKIIDNEI